MDKNYALVNDLISVGAFSPIGGGSTPTDFTGVFEGNGFTINTPVMGAADMDYVGIHRLGQGLY